MILTIRQRNIIELLLNVQTPMPSSIITQKIGLSNRQLNYNLKDIKNWLASKNIKLSGNASNGYILEIDSIQKKNFLDQLKNEKFQLILSSDHRQQLLILLLLLSDMPLNLDYFEEITLVSRSTILKDLDEVEKWLSEWEIDLLRKQNYGIEIIAQENRIQRALCALLWGSSSYNNSIYSISLYNGLTFNFDRDAHLLIVTSLVKESIDKINVLRNLQMIAFAEDQLGGRFTDDAVLFLALSLSIQEHRIKSDHHLFFEEDQIQLLQTLKIWQTSITIAKRLGWSITDKNSKADIVGISMKLASAPRNDRWISDYEFNQGIFELQEQLINFISHSYQNVDMQENQTIRDGLINHLAPSFFRKKFNFWMPIINAYIEPSTKEDIDYKVAQGCVNIIRKSTGIGLSKEDIAYLATLFRATIIRLQSNKTINVIVVCPSGMATSQLLLARLATRFPNFENVEIRSIRQLNFNQLNNTHLVITTVDLPNESHHNSQIIKVNPLLLPEDVEKITIFLQKNDKK